MSDALVSEAMDTTFLPL